MVRGIVVRSPNIGQSFVGAFKQKGDEAAIAGDSVSGKSKDGSPFTIDVSPSGSGSQGTIKVQDNDKD